MSSMSNQAVEPEIVASSVPKPERMMDGFPWVSAIILYTLSWGWSLLRPNTLYWEDWICLQCREVNSQTSHHIGHFYSIFSCWNIFIWNFETV
ncbi:MAG: hypothetical protein NTY54_03990 [Actinobacteria bacterium]|nr:hypothetical protein [Actinomycetota bacterium]